MNDELSTMLSVLEVLPDSSPEDVLTWAANAYAALAALSSVIEDPEALVAVDNIGKSAPISVIRQGFVRIQEVSGA